jgi:hypothetical protein
VGGVLIFALDGTLKGLTAAAAGSARAGVAGCGAAVETGAPVECAAPATAGAVLIFAFAGKLNGLAAEVTVPRTGVAGWEAAALIGPVAAKAAGQTMTPNKRPKTVIWEFRHASMAEVAPFLMLINVSPAAMRRDVGAGLTDCVSISAWAF